MTVTIINAGSQHKARDNEGDDGANLYRSKPKLRLAEAFGREEVDAEHHAQKQSAPNPSGHIGKPVLHDDLRGHQIHSHCDRPVVAVVDAHRQTEALVDVLFSVNSKGTRNRLKSR